jgi:hypothetical protein
VADASYVTQGRGSCNAWDTTSPVLEAKLWSKDIILVETPTHDNIRELVNWECKEHGVKS